MSSIYGSFGDVDPGVTTAMGQQLLHHGDLPQYASPAPLVRLAALNRNATGGPCADGSDAIVMCGCIVSAPVDLLDEHGGAANDTVSIEARLLRLYQRHGRKAIEVLNGHFALAVWDDAEKILLLCRDRFGIQPLYYAMVGSNFIFSSEYKALIVSSDLSREPDRSAIQYFQYTGWSPRERTFFRAVRPVPGGSWLEISSSGVRLVSFEPPGSSKCIQDLEANSIALRETLFSAVEGFSQGARRIGVALSGGLDSTALVAAAMRNEPKRQIHTFTVGYGSDDPELIGGAETARHYGTLHHEIVVQPQDLFELLPSSIWHMEDPVGRDEYPCLFAMAREAANYVDTLLMGNGSDTLFGGMSHHRLLRLANALPTLSPAVGAFLAYPMTGTNPETLGGRFLVRLAGIKEVPEVPHVCGCTDAPYRFALGADGSTSLQKQLRQGVMQFDGRLGSQESLCQAWGIDARMPYLDNRILELALTLPDDQKVRWFKGKYVLRQACSQFMPRAFAGRRKGIQHLRHDRAFADVLDELAEIFLSPADVRTRGLFSTGDVERLRRKRKGVYAAPQAYRLWYLIVTEVWARLFMDYSCSQVSQTGAGEIIGSGYDGTNAGMHLRRRVGL